MFALMIMAPVPALHSVNADTPDAVVRRLYRDFAWEAVLDEPANGGLLEQPRTVLQRYFDDHLVDLILADRKQATRTHDEGRLDFLPIWDSQDPGGATVRIAPPSANGDVVVDLAYSGRAPPSKLTFHVKHTKSGWRVADIVGHDWDLLKILTPPK